MISVLATLFVLALLVLMALAGYRDGLFFSTYALVRNLVAFLCAMTFSDMLAGVFAAIISDNPMAWGYFVVVSFALIFGAVFLLGRWLKMTYTIPHVPAISLVDRIAGPIVGAMNAVLVTGAVLIFGSMLPFPKYLPNDLGRATVRVRALDTGVAMLHVFDYVQHRMGGNRHFMLEPEAIQTDANGNGRADPGDEFVDLNGNDQWDHGRLWRYRTSCEIMPEDLPPEFEEEF